jgi:PAS domain S-box-containing protein
VDDTRPEPAAVHARLMAALKASRCGTWRWDIAADRVEWDEALCEVYGLAPEQAPRNAAAFLALVHPDDRERAQGLIGACLESGSEIEYEFRVQVGERIVWIYDRSGVVRDDAGRPLVMTGACLDVTERKRLERERDEALEKHKWLLAELNHRVKNHLQMVTAMLALQAAAGDAALRDAFEQAIRRIETVAELHGRLYRDGTPGAVDLAAYLADICQGLKRSLLEGRAIRLAWSAPPGELALDRAVPLGLIVNELVTNAIKHAFPAGRGGQITVRLEAAGGQARLEVSDDGLGLAPGMDAGGFGTRLVQGLARQIGATLTLAAGAGTTHRLDFALD